MRIGMDDSTLKSVIAELLDGLIAVIKVTKHLGTKHDIAVRRSRTVTVQEPGRSAARDEIQRLLCVCEMPSMVLSHWTAVSSVTMHDYHKVPDRPDPPLCRAGRLDVQVSQSRRQRSLRTGFELCCRLRRCSATFRCTRHIHTRGGRCRGVGRVEDAQAPQ